MPCVGQGHPDVTVAIRVATRQTETHGRDGMAVVEVGFVPAAGRSGTAVAAGMLEIDPELEMVPGAEVPLDPLERDIPTQDSEARRPGRGRDGLTKQQAQLRHVPYPVTAAFARDAVEAALQAHGVMAAMERLESMTNRAKSSALLPEVRLRAGRDTDQSLRLTPTSEDPYRFSQSGGVSLLMEGALTWRLGRVVFAGEELGIERLRLAQARERQRVTSLLLNELLTWQTAWRRVQAYGDEANAALEDVVEASMRLDALTGGWFSAHQPAGARSNTLQPTKDDVYETIPAPDSGRTRMQNPPQATGPAEPAATPALENAESHFHSHLLEHAAVSR
ncbi:MAG: hypothetical protein ACM3ZE_27575 [Myxococcales bacterium]